MTGPCAHFETVMADLAPPKDVCETCVEIGTQWVHLRQCMACGRTGCCDNSPMRHATGHWKETAHPVIRSGEPGEDWAWCFPDAEVFVPGPDGWEPMEG